MINNALQKKKGECPRCKSIMIKAFLWDCKINGKQETNVAVCEECHDILAALPGEEQ